MYKFLIIVVTIGSYVLASPWENTPEVVKKTNSDTKHFCWAQDFNNDDDKLERRRRKGSRGRHRGGSGLR